MKANAGFWKLPVAIISNGNTVKNTEYSFLANVFAARGHHGEMTRLRRGVGEELPQCHATLASAA